MKYLFVLLFLFIGIYTFGQEVTYHFIRPKHQSIAFPVFDAHLNPNFNLINWELQLSELNRILSDEKEPDRVTEDINLKLTFVPVYQNDRVFCFSLDRATGNEQYTNRYAFDIYNGIEISPSTLFTKEGFEAINNDIGLRNRLRLMEYTKHLNPNSKQDIITRKLFLERNEYFDFEYLDITITEDSIYFGRSNGTRRFSAVNWREWDFSFGYSIKEIVPHLSKYGKWILGWSDDIVQRTRVWNGSIGGKYPITLWITDASIEYNSWSSSKEFLGYYVYNKYKQPIRLSIDQDDDVWVLYEKTVRKHGEFPTAYAHFDLKETDHMLLGTWLNYEAQQSLEVILEEK